MKKYGFRQDLFEFLFLFFLKRIVRVMNYFVGKNAVVLVIQVVVDIHFPCCDEECVSLVVLPVRGERSETISFHSRVCLVV